MIRLLNDLPSHVIGFEVSGKVTAEDFRDVVIPAVEKAAESGDVRFVIQIPDFHGMTVGALEQDLKIAKDNFRKWNRIALVSDIEWMHHMISMFGWMMAGDVKSFPTKERDAAIAWVSEEHRPG